MEIKQQLGIRKISELLVVIALLGGLHGQATASDVSLTWDASTSEDVVNYKVYVGESLSNNICENADLHYYDNHDGYPKLIGNQTEYTLLDLPQGGTYCVAVTALNEEKDESVFSNRCYLDISRGGEIVASCDLPNNDANRRITLGTTIGSPGATTPVPVLLQSDADDTGASLLFDISYPQSLSFHSASSGTIVIIDETGTVNDSRNEINVKIPHLTLSGFGEDTIATLNFTISKHAPVGTIALEPGDAILYDTEGHVFSVPVVPGSITVLAGTAPVISDVNVTVTGNSATITWTTNEDSDSTVEYWTGNGARQTAASTILAISHSVTLNDLTEGSSYSYQVKSKDAAGNEAVSDVFTFTTKDTTPPVISGVAHGNVTGNSATITWTTNEDSDSTVEYWTGNGARKTASSTVRAKYHSIILTGLTDASSYSYQVKSKDAAGNEAASAVFTFTTKDTTPPVISNVQVAMSDNNKKATITWTTDEDSDSTVEYWIGIGAHKTSSSSVRTKFHSVTLNELTTGTTYSFKVSSKDASGNEAIPRILTFKS